MKQQDQREGHGEGVSPWLASLFLKRSGSLLPRFAVYYQRVARLPRPWQRRLRHKLAVTVAGAALLLALSGPVVAAQPPPVDASYTIVTADPETGVAIAAPAAAEATITVVNGEVRVLANGKCSLIEAIQNANNGNTGQPNADCAAGNPSGADTIVLPAGGSFVLTAIHNSVFGATGLPTIKTAITIEGNGATIARSGAAGTPVFRIMAVDPVGNLTLRNTTITGGGNRYNYDFGSGGGLLNEGTLTVEQSRITGNATYWDGGGIANGGTLVVKESSITDNLGYNGGGGVSNGGTATITRSLVSGNSAHYYAGGIDNSGLMTIVNSTVSGNGSSEDGGGIMNMNDGTLTLTNATVTGNSSVNIVGGIWNAGQLTLNRTIVSGNINDLAQYYTGNGQSEFWNGNEGTVIANNRNIFGYDGDSGIWYGFTPGATDIVPTVGLNAILSPLADNGGPTKTHALPAGSPALDRAPSADCTAAPILGVDQRVQPRNQNGAGGVTADECDVGAFELGTATPPPVGPSFYISAKGSGTIGGVAFAPADILKYDPATGWSMYFDGSDVGITQNLIGFEMLDDGSILMALAGGQNVSGVGSVSPRDVLRFIPASTGPNTNGTFQMYVKGSTVGLTTADEKIDALGLTANGRIAISTVGAAAVPGPSGTIKAQDEDALGFNKTNSTWSLFFDGTPIPGMSVEDVNALWVNPTTGELYVSILNAFTIGGLKGDAKDIIKLTPKTGGGYNVSMVWDGSAAGFPSTIDGLEMIP